MAMQTMKIPTMSMKTMQTMFLTITTKMQTMIMTTIGLRPQRLGPSFPFQLLLNSTHCKRNSTNDDESFLSQILGVKESPKCDISVIALNHVRFVSFL